jgi:hypothetical protein
MIIPMRNGVCNPVTHVLCIPKSSYVSIGIVNPIDETDSTIFGSIVSGNEFESRNASVFNSGTKGVDTTLNHVLLAQLTTTGELYFELNLEIEVESPNGNQIIKYVARDSSLALDELLPWNQ